MIDADLVEVNVFDNQRGGRAWTSAANRPTRLGSPTCRAAIAPWTAIGLVLLVLVATGCAQPAARPSPSAVTVAPPAPVRVGASGTNLGSNSAAFAARVLAPRLGATPGDLRVAIVNAEDEYARSVADAAARTATEAGLSVVARASYNLSLPHWPALMSELSSTQPDVVILASHIPDGIAFRRAMLADR